MRVGLQEQPLQFLRALLERPGDLVTREQLRERLWPGGTFVDFEHGLNAVVNRLRDTLGDSASRHAYIETLPGVAIGSSRLSLGPNAAEGVGRKAGSPARIDVTRRWSAGLALPGRRGWAIAIAAGLLALVAGGAWLLRPTPTVGSQAPRVVRLTTLAGQEDIGRPAPDGEQVAFAWTGEKDVTADIYVTLVGSTDVRRVTTDPGTTMHRAGRPTAGASRSSGRVGNAARIHIASALGGPDVKVSDFPVAARD